MYHSRSNENYLKFKYFSHNPINVTSKLIHNNIEDPIHANHSLLTNDDSDFIQVRYAIKVLAYKRPVSLLRLLKSLSTADYSNIVSNTSQQTHTNNSNSSSTTKSVNDDKHFNIHSNLLKNSTGQTISLEILIDGNRTSEDAILVQKGKLIYNRCEDDDMNMLYVIRVCTFEKAVVTC